METEDACPYPVIAGLNASMQQYIQTRHTQTSTLLLYNVCDSPNRQNAGHLKMPPSLSAAVNGSSTRGSLLFILHCSILLKRDACSAVVRIGQHNIHCMEHVASLPCLQEAHYMWITKLRG